jgi:type IV pilus assembly protein PilB
MAKLIEAGWDGPTDAAHITGAQGRGCERCGGTGYKGRVGLFEVMEMTEPLREMVVANATVVDLKKRAMAEGMVPLRQAGLRKVAEGMTTIEEVVRETI